MEPGTGYFARASGEFIFTIVLYYLREYYDCVFLKLFHLSIYLKTIFSTARILQGNKTVLSIFCHLSFMNSLQSVDDAIVLVLK